MAETAGDTQNRSNISYRDYGGRIHSYGIWGTLLLLGLVAAAILAYFQVSGPNLIFVDVAVWVLALVVFLMAVCLLVVLFTLRGALRQVREQATEVAVMRAMAHRHEIVEPMPAPAPAYAAPEPNATQVTPTPTYARPLAPSRDVEVIEGIGPTFRRRLARHGIETLRDLRAATVTELADASQASPSVVERWKSMADLMVVTSVDPQAAEILVFCGINSVEQLAGQNADTLHRRCQQANNSREFRIVPDKITKDQVTQWVEGARNYATDGNPNTTARGDTEASGVAAG